MRALLCEKFVSRCSDNADDQWRALAPFAMTKEFDVIIDAVGETRKSRMLDKYLELVEAADETKAGRIKTWLKAMHENRKFLLRHRIDAKVRATPAIFGIIVSEREDVDGVFLSTEKGYRRLRGSKAAMFEAQAGIEEITKRRARADTGDQGAGARGASVSIMIGDMVGGDKYQDVASSTIINRSKYVGHLEVIESRDPKLGVAFERIGEHIGRKGDTTAGEIAEALTEAVAKGDANKPVLDSLLRGLTDISEPRGEYGKAIKTIREWIDTLE